MKKAYTFLILLAVIAGCIIAAGCTGATTDATNNPLPEKVAFTITVTKEGGATYNVGDIAELKFVTNPTTGYDWHIVKGEEILYNEFSDADQQPDGLVGAPSNKTFWFQAEEEGDYPIELIYARSWDIENTTFSTYSDVLHVVKSDEANANGPKSSFVYDSFAINPSAGEFVKIVTTVKPTLNAAYTQSGDGLIIRGENTPASQNTVGSSEDLYVWYVTATKPGDYTFTASLQKLGSSGEAEEISNFTIPLKFV